MKHKIITDALIAEILYRIRVQLPCDENLISCEIQDDGQFLLISIAIDTLHESAKQKEKFRQIGALLNKIMPGRHGEYSWMVAFTEAGKVVESYFGGDLDCPGSGLH